MKHAVFLTLYVNSHLSVGKSFPKDIHMDIH